MTDFIINLSTQQVEIGDSTQSNIVDLALTCPGENRTTPTIGGCLEDYLSANITASIRTRLREQLNADGVKNIEINTDGNTISITGNYGEA